MGDLVRTADLKQTFSKGETTNWSYKFDEITENASDTIPVYGIDNLPERHYEALLQRKKLTPTKNSNIIKRLHLSF